MYQTGKTAPIAAEMNNYHLALLGISETRWIQTGQRNMPKDSYYSSLDMKKTMFPHRRGSIHARKSGTEDIGRTGSLWTANPYSIFQNKEKENQYR